ncbi:hypothetical protein KQX54_013121 [Cotesia glomerata]|uniref:FLYWCH-type domain-containing protein n=1 Tax=Cotesia glomerata TaxID=32391 RepID=A0AAV7IYX9_COTGL|nr:hypothetical protein KQX54_013121 [Cotesia glomerata]
MANKGEIIEDGFSYYVEKTVNDKKYVYCKKRKSKNCPVRGTKTLDEPIKFTVSTHRHALDFYSDDVKRFRRELIAAAEKNLYPINEIYTTIAKSHLEDVTIQLPYAVISTVIRQHQKEAADDLTELLTYKDFVDFFERAENLCFMRYADKKNVIVSNVDNDALLIGDPEFSKSGQDGHYAFSIGIILWTKVAREPCTEILNQVKQRLIPNVNIAKIYVDFDLKLFVEEVFPESDVRGTFNNYCRIIFHEALRNNDLRLMIPEHEEFLKKCFSLILLLSNKIKEGFEEIKGVTPRSMSLYEKVKSLNTVPILFRTTLENYMGEKPSLRKFWSNFIVLLNKSTNER